MDTAPEGWYQQLSIKFEDGTVQILHIQRKLTGTHIPERRLTPEPWTALSFHKCPCCPFPDGPVPCPAALSLQTTMSKLRSRKSFERVTATAIDAQGRSQTVEWPLQDVGSALVQLAVFASGCPVGRRLKPYLQGLPPFVTSLELSRHVAKLILQRHGGSIDGARQELAESLAPLHDVFSHLTLRIRTDEQDKAAEGSAEGPETLGRDAVPNSITQVDAIAQLLALRSDKLFSQLAADLGWNEKPGQPAAAQPEDAGLWRKLTGLFRSDP
ncbi:MAG TPA: hypothetical protein DCM05_01160 [Elusimicrobia bacterium]|nr:hypothetical protein [Elusimicrobiota bacterium]